MAEKRLFAVAAAELVLSAVQVLAHADVAACGCRTARAVWLLVHAGAMELELEQTQTAWARMSRVVAMHTSPGLAAAVFAVRAEETRPLCTSHSLPLSFAGQAAVVPRPAETAHASELYWRGWVSRRQC